MTEEQIKRSQKTKEVATYFWAGIAFTLSIAIIFILITNAKTYFDFTINFANTLEIGFLAIKMILLLAIIIIDLKTIGSIKKEWDKYTYKEKTKDERIVEEEIGRISPIKRWIFYWRLWGARAKLDEYNDLIKKMERLVGKIKGDEVKDLIKLKSEVINSILLWKEDFAITKPKSNEPVDEEFLQSLYLDELYEDYLIKCVDSAERFINGISEEENLVNI